QIGRALVELGVELPTTDTGRPKVTEDVLSKVAAEADGRAQELARAVLEFRKHDKALSTYLDPYRLLCELGDGRARPTIYTLGAAELPEHPARGWLAGVRGQRPVLRDDRCRLLRRRGALRRRALAGPHAAALPGGGPRPARGSRTAGVGPGPRDQREEGPPGPEEGAPLHRQARGVRAALRRRHHDPG